MDATPVHPHLGEKLRNIGIVGAGQAGLQLGFMLLAKGYPVTVYSERSPEQIFNARLATTAAQFGRASSYERELGIDFWNPRGGHVLAGADLDVCPEPGQRAISVRGRISAPGFAMDGRAKYARWLSEFERRGGNVVLGSVDMEALEQFALKHELVLVSTGRNSFTQLFERDAARSPHTRPQRHLAAMIVEGMKPLYESSFPALKFVLTPGHGEYFAMPFHDRMRGPLYSLLFEAVPGGDMDRFGGVTSAREAMERARGIAHDYSPWIGERMQHAYVVDESSWLTGAFTPTVRKPVGTLPSSRRVMGLGDAVILNDPVAGQGLNCASKMAHHVGVAILARAGEPFTAQWMHETFERFWDTDGQYITAFSNMLLQPPPPHLQQLLGAASQDAAVAEMFFSNFAEPQDFWPWIMSPAETEAQVQRVARRA
jgi:2-polyprenyl-6-methoxyphenol hydroxylase-like FAD-dependent oxidoreductase